MCLLAPVWSCATFAFRVLVNLSHSSHAWSSCFLENPRTLSMVLRCISIASRAGGQEKSTELLSPAVGDERDTQTFDQLCLALAFLTNLVQGADEAKRLMRDTCTFIVSILDTIC